MVFERKWIKLWSSNQILFFSEKKRNTGGKHVHVVLHFYVWGLKRRGWKRRLCVENVSCTDTDKTRQDTVFLKKQFFSSVSSLVSFDPIKVIKMGKGHSLAYCGRGTHFCSISRSRILEAEYSLATCVSIQRWQYRNCLCRIAKRTVLAFPCFSYGEQ